MLAVAPCPQIEVPLNLFLRRNLKDFNILKIYCKLLFFKRIISLLKNKVPKLAA
jgi:hypothetical protein